jgi:hypothetical protein
MTATDIFLHHVPGIQEALDRCGETRTIEDVIAEVQSQHAQVWGDERALIITQLVGEYVHFFIATGEMDAVVELSHEIMQWARDLGYTKATLTGRRGWVKALAHEGWQERAVLMERDL